jgi:hypothetical protein
MFVPTSAFTLRSFARTPHRQPNAGTVRASLLESLLESPPEPLLELPIEACQAARMIVAGRAPRGLVIKGHLNLSNTGITQLPGALRAFSLDVSGCTRLRALPDDLQVRRLNISGCIGLHELPPGLCLSDLLARDLPLRVLPSDLCVQRRLDVSGCTQLEVLPRRLRARFVAVAGCSLLTA